MKIIIFLLTTILTLSGCGAPRDSRVLLTKESKDTLAPGFSSDDNCLKEHPVTNVDPANTTVTYSSSEHGFKVDLPYNSAWGPERFRIAPYDSNDEKIFYGHMRDITVGAVGTPCEWWLRDYTIMVEDPVNSGQELIDNHSYLIKKEATDLVTFSSYYTKKGLQVLGQEANYCGNGNVLFVIGKNHTYIFTGPCDKNNAIEVLKKIVDTVELL